MTTWHLPTLRGLFCLSKGDTGFACAEPVPGSIQYEAHPLDAAPSPLLRALPAYEREFRAHVSRGRAFADAAEARLAVADQLLAEMVGFKDQIC